MISSKYQRELGSCLTIEYLRTDDPRIVASVQRLLESMDVEEVQHETSRMDIGTMNRIAAPFDVPSDTQYLDEYSNHLLGLEEAYDPQVTCDSEISRPSKGSVDVAHNRESDSMQSVQKISIVNPVNDSFEAIESADPNMKVMVLGLDCEWKPSHLYSRPASGLNDTRQEPTNRSDEYNKTDVLQLSSKDYCLVINISDAESLPLSISKILSRSDIVKVGVDIASDVQRIYKDFSIETTNVIDLRNIIDDTTCCCENITACTCSIRFERERRLRQQFGLRSLALMHLNIAMDKSPEIRCSDWSIHPLSEMQVEYAAWDACTATHLCSKLFQSVPRSSDTSPDLSAHPHGLLQRDIIPFLSKIDYGSSEKRLAEERQHQTRLLPSIAGSKPSIDTIKQVKAKKRHKVEARKSLLYDNCKMYSPDGKNILSTCSRKKLQWYIDRGLAELMDEDGSKDGDSEPDRPPSIQLLFQPKCPSKIDDSYYQSDKQNICVVCGVESDYLRYSIVPSQYRIYLPKVMKAHLSHDVVLLCLACHERSIAHDYRYSQSLARIYNAPMGGNGDRLIANQDIKQVKTSCIVLLRRKSELPPTVRRKHRDIVRKYFQTIDNSCDDLAHGQDKIESNSSDIIEGDDDDDIPEEILQRGTELDDKTINVHWKSHGEMVVTAIIERQLQQLRGLDADYIHVSEEERLAIIVPALADFVRGWRAHFLSSMTPKHLPENWSVDSKVVNSNFTTSGP